MEINEFLEINRKLDLILANQSVEPSNTTPATQVKNIDSLGRVTIPKNIRRDLDIQDGAEVGISYQGNKIILEILK